MKTLKYIDINSTGLFHSGFNASSLLMMSEIYDKVDYYADESSALSTKKLLKGNFPNNITYIPIKVIKKNNKFGNIFHHLNQIYNSLKIIIKSNKSQIIYFNYAPVLAIPFINLICKITKKKVIITFHNELSTLQENSTFRYNRITTKILKNLKEGQKKWAENLYYCVLGEHIKKNTQKTLFSEQLQDKILSFEHSWIFTKKNKIKKTEKDKKIGIIGSVREERWLDDIFSFRKKIQSDIDITLIGRIFCNKDILIQNGLKFIPGADEHFVSKELMSNTIQEMDFIVFLYPTNSYKFVCSGALFDAIEEEKYIIALHNDCFDSLLKNADGNCKLFNTVEEMINYVNTIKIEELELKDFSIIKNTLSPENQAIEFKKELEKIKFIL